MNREKRQLVDKLFRNISHEIKNPLTALKGHTQLLGLHAQDEFVKDTASVIESHIDEAIRRFNVLYPILSLQAKSPLSFDLHKLIREYASLSPHTIDITKLAKPRIIESDKSLLERICKIFFLSPNSDYYDNLEIIIVPVDNNSYLLQYPGVQFSKNDFDEIELPYSTKVLYTYGYEYFELATIFQLLGFHYSFENEHCFSIRFSC